MTDLDEALAITLDVEGGWSDHPADPGGKTMYGITWRTYRRAVRLGHIAPNPQGVRGITVAQARKIYEVMYWDAVVADKLPRGLNALVFDIEVNSGRGAKTLQRALRGVHAARIAVDGQIGPQTLAVVEAVWGSPARAGRLMDEVNTRRHLWWARLPIFATFGLGWFRRGSRVYRHACRMAGEAI